MRVPLIATLVLLAALLAGCHEADDPGAGGPGDDGTGGDGGNGDPPADDGDLSVAVTSTPTTIAAGEMFTWRWRVSGPDGTEITHTAIHWGPESVPSDPTPAAYANGTNQPAYYTGTVPQEFEHDVTMAGAGTHYYRAHAVAGGGEQWTDEETILVAAFVITGMPQARGDPFVYEATLPVSGTSDHTGAHYAESEFQDTDDEGVRATAHLEAERTFTANQAEEVSVAFDPAEPGTYFLRPHVLLLDGTVFWGQLVEVTVS